MSGVKHSFRSGGMIVAHQCKRYTSGLGTDLAKTGFERSPKSSPLRWALRAIGLTRAWKSKKLPDFADTPNDDGRHKCGEGLGTTPTVSCSGGRKIPFGVVCARPVWGTLPHGGNGHSPKVLISSPGIASSLSLRMWRLSQ